jgi:hypothetical protein
MSVPESAHRRDIPARSARHFLVHDGLNAPTATLSVHNEARVDRGHPVSLCIDPVALDEVEINPLPLPHR